MEKKLEIPAPPGGTSPGIAAHDLLKYLPVIIQIGEAVLTGQGSFKTWSPTGTLYVTVSRTPPST